MNRNIFISIVAIIVLCSACDIDLTREEWYHLYLSAGQSLQ